MINQILDYQFTPFFYKAFQIYLFAFIITVSIGGYVFYALIYPNYIGNHKQTLHLDISYDFKRVFLSLAVYNNLATLYYEKPDMLFTEFEGIC